jgi:hypothetical protein
MTLRKAENKKQVEASTRETAATIPSCPARKQPLPKHNLD